MVKVTSLLDKAGSRVGFSFGVRAWTEMEIQCVKGMHRLKLISSENNSGFSISTFCTLCTALLPGFGRSKDKATNP